MNTHDPEQKGSGEALQDGQTTSDIKKELNGEGQDA
jgi:hypothetical protein